MTITESTPPRLVAMSLAFTRPFACTNQVRFEVGPSGDGLPA